MYTQSRNCLLVFMELSHLQMRRRCGDIISSPLVIIFNNPSLLSIPHIQKLVLLIDNISKETYTMHLGLDNIIEAIFSQFHY